jgi:hypothetical protein
MNEESQTIPDGLTCGDCRRYPKCSAFIGVKRNNTECDYFPVNFVASSVLFAAYKRDVLRLGAEVKRLREAAIITDTNGERCLFCDGQNQDYEGVIHKSDCPLKDGPP